MERNGLMRLFMETKILRRPQVESRVGYGRSAIYEQMAAGTFPKPIKLSERVTCWKVSEVRTWMAAQTAHGYTPALVAKKRSKCISPVAA